MELASLYACDCEFGLESLHRSHVRGSYRVLVPAECLASGRVFVRHGDEVIEDEFFAEEVDGSEQFPIFA